MGSGFEADNLPHTLRKCDFSCHTSAFQSLSQSISATFYFIPLNAHRPFVTPNGQCQVGTVSLLECFWVSIFLGHLTSWLPFFVFLLLN